MKLFFDLIPLILFFISYKIYGMYTATAVLMVVTLLQVLYARWRHGKVETMLWLSFLLILVLGSATLLLNDERFIKWKPTLLYWAFGSGILIAQAFFGKNPLGALMGRHLRIPDAMWRQVNYAWAVFFLAMGGLNLAVAQYFSTDVWVNFKLFGTTLLMLVFIFAQMLLLSRFIKEDDSK